MQAFYAKRNIILAQPKHVENVNGYMHGKKLTPFQNSKFVTLNTLEMLHNVHQ